MFEINEPFCYVKNYRFCEKKTQMDKSCKIKLPVGQLLDWPLLPPLAYVPIIVPTGVP